MILFKDDQMTVYQLKNTVYYVDAPKFLCKRMLTAIRDKASEDHDIKKIILTPRRDSVRAYDITLVPIRDVCDAKKTKVLEIANDSVKVHF